MKDMLRRALRTFVQAASGYIAANIVETITNVGGDNKKLKAAIMTLITASVAFGIAAVMNLPADYDENGNRIDKGDNGVRGDDGHAGSAYGKTTPTYVLEWHEGTDPVTGTVHPTASEIAANREIIEQIAGEDDGHYLLYLNIGGTRTVPVSGIFASEFRFTETDSDNERCDVYVISRNLPYSQEKTAFVETNSFDDMSSRPASQEATAEWARDEFEALTVIASPAGSFTVAHGTEYRFGERASLTLTLPSLTANSRLDSWISFTSGVSPTSFSYPDGIVWSGDDISDGEFVPAASKRYNIALWYDGSAVNGIVKGVNTDD